MVDLRPHVYGKGARLYFDNLEAAKLKAKELATEQKNKGAESIDFPTELRVEAAECFHILQPLGARLRDAVEHYVKWMKNEKHRLESRKVSDCMDDYLAARELDVKGGELAATSLREIRGRMSQFKAVWGDMPIMGITRQVVLRYLENAQAAGQMARSRINLRAHMSNFLNFCVKREWIDHSPCVKIKIKVKESEPSIVTLDQAKALMEAAAKSKHADKMVPYFALCLFAGLRPSEARRLDWSRIRFEDGRIEILGETSKTRRRRWAKIESNGLAWMKPHAKEAGNILQGISETTWKRQFDSIRVAAKFLPDPKAEETEPKGKNLWDEDIMRHSFASYWLPVHKNAPELAEIMGNSVPVIRKNYENAVLEAVALKYWEITP